MKRFHEFFEEGNGQLSSTRLMMVVMILAGIFITIYALVQNRLDANVITVSSLLHTLALGGKVAQKSQEDGAPTKPNVQG